MFLSSNSPSRPRRSSLLGALLALLLLPLFAVDCGGTPSGPAVASGPPASQFAESFAQALCNNLAACCKTNALAFDAANCVTAAQGDVQALIAPATASGAIYDPGAAAACLSAIATMAQQCDDAVTSQGSGGSELAYPAVCNDVYAGSTAPGQPCTNKYDCAPGPSGSTVTCLAFDNGTADGGLASGQICQVQVAGTVGAVCNSSSATPPGTIASCDAAGLVCGSAGTCQDPTALGAACRFGVPCVAGAYCSQAGTCVAASAAGAPCVPLQPSCVSGYYCDASSSTCLAQKGAGAQCSGAADEAYECTGECSSAETCTTSTLATPALCGG